MANRFTVLSEFTGIPAAHFAAADACYSCRVLATVESFIATAVSTTGARPRWLSWPVCDTRRDARMSDGPTPFDFISFGTKVLSNAEG